MEKIGLLAGVGHLPAACARAARALGYEVHAVALLPDTDPELKDAANVYREISIGQIASILAYLQQEEIKKVTMIGKVTKELLFTGAIVPDEMLRGMLMQLPNQNDDTIMMMFVGALMKIGVTPLDQTALIRPLMPAEGTLTSRAPSEAERRDMAGSLRAAAPSSRRRQSRSRTADSMCPRSGWIPSNPLLPSRRRRSRSRRAKRSSSTRNAPLHLRRRTASRSRRSKRRRSCR